MNNMTIKEYVIKIAEYIEYEFDNYGKNMELNSVQQSVLNGIVLYNYDEQNSINNSAADVVHFLKLIQNPKHEI
jgi:hypothetical protein